jgi:diadenosine tetraphosphate (Ap4A) HIT family hydrolase
MDGVRVVWRDAQLRVIQVDDADYPGFCRVIWGAHIAEMSDLPADARAHVHAVLHVVEQVLRARMGCDKINLASLGNVVPHLHWHVIPRFKDDAHFPQAIWASREREVPAARQDARRARAADLNGVLRAALDAAMFPANNTSASVSAAEGDHGRIG